jgi:hypothetical protein
MDPAHVMPSEAKKLRSSSEASEGIVAVNVRRVKRSFRRPLGDIISDAGVKMFAGIKVVIAPFKPSMGFGEHLLVHGGEGQVWVMSTAPP